MPLAANFGLEHRQVLGRRPAVVRCAPSKPMPWWIGAWAEDRRFTQQQEAELIRLGRDPVTQEAMTVRREAPDAEVWTPLHQWRPIYEFDAPLLGHRADGKATIIAPDGSRRHIRADGWAQKPSSRPNTGASW